MGSETILITNPNPNQPATQCPCCGDPINERWIYREYARLMGRRYKGKTSEKKAEASRKNGLKGGAQTGMKINLTIGHPYALPVPYAWSSTCADPGFALCFAP